MELSREAEDALFGLFAVKLDYCSETAVEKALAKAEKQRANGDEVKSLQRLLVEAGSMNRDQAKQVSEQLDPAVIEGYEILGEAGRGGMGVVYRARQLSMDREVAVKVLSRRLSRDETFVAKFLTEARSAAKLNHENIVAAINAGESNGLHHFAMEFVAGRSVAESLDDDGPLPVERTIEIAEQIARALEHAHAAGLVHRDVKPENIMIGADGRAKLCDLGLAKPAQEAGTGEKSATTEGTPYYCSPEQALGRTDIDPRSDVYSLGATLFHMLDGEPPFDGDTARAIMIKQVREPFPNLDKRMPDVPAPYRRLLERMCVKDREKRMGSMREFKEQLTAARKEVAKANRTPSQRAAAAHGARFPLWAGVVGVFVAFAVLGAAVSLALLDDDPGLSTTGPAPGDPGGPSTPPDGGTQTPDGPPTVPGDGIETTTPDPTPGGEEDDEIAAARAAFKEASDYRSGNPDDPWGAVTRFKQVVELYPTTSIAREAEGEISSLADAIAQSASQGLETLALDVLAKLERGAFAAAEGAVAAFSKEWTPRKVPKLADRLARLHKSIDQQATVALTAALAKTDAGLDELKGLLGRLPQSLKRASPKQVARLEGRVAAGLLRKVSDDVGEAFAAGDTAKAVTILNEALADPQLPASAKAPLEQAKADLDGQARARDVFVAGCEGLVRRGTSFTRLEDGSPGGRLLFFEAADWTFRLQAADGEAREVTLGQLPAAEVASLGLPPREGRFNALFLLSRGAPRAANMAYGAYLRQGGRADPAIQERIDAGQSLALEMQITALIDGILEPGQPAEAVVAKVKALPKNAYGAKVYRSRYTLIQAAYTKARTEQLSGDVATLFNGAYSVDRKGKVELVYTFDDPAQARDFIVDTSVDAASACSVKEEEGLVVRGKVLHVARFAGGDLKVELKVVPANASTPNCNVVLSSERGWRGQLCGVGFKFGDLKSIKIDNAARKRGGYVVDLPASVFLILNGKEPRRRMPQVFAAEEGASLKSRANRVSAQRTRKGKLKLKIGSRTIYQVGPVPGWETAGHVALSPFSSEIAIQSLEISGTLEPGWAEARVSQLAETEAKALPLPR